MDDTQLEAMLREAQMGNAVAFGRVYGEFSSRVFGLCRKMLGSQAAAEDATSEVFERAYQALDSYDRERPFDRWILTILADAGVNITDMLNRSRGELAYNIIDVENEVTDADLEKIRTIEGVYRAEVADDERIERAREVVGAFDLLKGHRDDMLVLGHTGG